MGGQGKVPEVQGGKADTKASEAKGKQEQSQAVNEFPELIEHTRRAAGGDVLRSGPGSPF